MLSDEETILAIAKSKNRNFVQKEIIVDPSQPIQKYKNNPNPISTFNVDESIYTLLVTQQNKSNTSSIAIQYDLESAEKLNIFEQVNMKVTLSNTRINNLCFIGGWNCFDFRILETINHQVLAHPILTDIKHIDSVEVCELGSNETGDQLILAVIGRQTTLTNSTLNLFDITSLTKKHMIVPEKCIEIGGDSIDADISIESKSDSPAVEPKKQDFSACAKQWENTLQNVQDKLLSSMVIIFETVCKKGQMAHVPREEMRRACICGLNL